MSFNVIKDGETEGTVVLDKDNSKLLDKAIDVVTAPIQFGTDKYVTLTNRAVSVITHAVLFGFLGEAVGHMRARSGKQSFVPVLR